jgi:hypothetical protein
VVVALLLVASVHAAPPDTAPAAGSKAGSVTALLPVANIVRGPAKQEVTTVAKKGDDVVWNDLVRTDKGGRARITLLDQSILSVGSQAELRIIKHDAKSQQTSIEVGYGRVRMEVTPVTKQGGSFEVKTPTAVAGVIGTVFGIDSAIGATTFLCLSGTVMVGSNDPTIPGRVPCTPGMAAVVNAGKAPATRPATQQEIQQFVQATEPAVISAMNPSSLLPGATADVTLTGTQLGNVNAVSASSPSVTATLNAGGTATSVSVHLVVAANATPGPVTLTLSKPSGVSSAAVFSVLAPPNTATAAGGDYKQPFLNTIDQERQSAIAGLNGLGVGLAQSADQAYNQISAANSALNPPMDISQAVTDLKGPVNAEMNAATVDGTSVNQAAQTAVTNFTNLYNTAWQALLARVPGGAPDNQFQNDLANAFSQVNATLLAAFAAAQADLGQQVQAQNGNIQQITNTWLAKIQQVAQSQAPPSIKGLSATASPPGGGVPVTITGTNFDPNTKVMFGNVASSNVTFISSTQLNVITPPGTPGMVDVTVVTGSGLTSTLAGGFSFGGPVAAISPQDKTVTPGEPLTLDGSRSSDTLAGTTLTYSWTFCSLGFKPPQVGASLPPMSAPACNPAPGTVLGSDSLFALSAPVTPGQYFARLQVTDNLGASAVIFSSVTVSPPTYDDALTRMNALAQAFSTLQSSLVLGFFDPSYTGLTTLQQSLQTVFPTYSSMTVNLLSVTPNITGNTAQIQANWQLRYTIKNDPACANVPSCQPPTYSPSPETQTTVWTLNPSKGWFVSEFRLPNGFTQGTLPAVPVTITSQPDLKLIGVDSPTTPGSPIPVGTGQQSFRATAQNIGTADFTQTTSVTFTLSVPNFSQLGSISAPIGPIAVGKTAQATITVNVPDSITVVTAAQITASVNTGCPIPESDCANNGGTFPVVITPPTVALPDLAIVPGSLSPTTATGACGATAAQACPLGSGLQSFKLTVQNVGNAPFAPATAPAVQFTLDVGNGPTALSTPLPPLTSNPPQVQFSSPQFNVPATGAGTLTATITGCPSPNVEPNCTNNTATIYVQIAAVTVTVNSAANNSAPGAPGQAACGTGACSTLELNGPLAQTMTLTPVRSDKLQGGNATLVITDIDPTRTSTSPQLVNSVPIGSAGGPVTVTAAIDASGNISQGPAQVLVTATTQGVPTAGPQLTTLFFNIGDISLSLQGTPCIPVVSGQAQLSAFTINALSGFSIPTVDWQWSGLGGASVDQLSGTAKLSGSTYTVGPFTFSGVVAGLQTFLFAVTIANPQGGSSATKTFPVNLNLSAAPCAGAAPRFGVGSIVTGTWSRGAFGGGMAKVSVRPVQTAGGPLPDLQIDAATVSFTPSIPKPGDTVAVRFRVTNAGNADAQRVPISLVINGVAVASGALDIRAGASTLAALEWTNARAPSGSRSVRAVVVVDPGHTVTQKSALAKSAPLAHFAFLPTWGAPTGMQLQPAAQRATLEVADGGCVGFRFASGAGSACGSADVEITVEQLAGGRFTLTAQNGIADLGPAFGGGKLVGVQYQPEVPAVAGHIYAVQLRGGKTGVLRLMAIRNSAQASATGRQVFRAGNVARNVGGETTGSVETGDVSGVRTPNQPKAYFEVSYQTQ